MKLQGKLKDFFSSHGVVFTLDLGPYLNKCSLDGSIFWLEATSGHLCWNQNILAQCCWRTIIFISVSIWNPLKKLQGKRHHCQEETELWAQQTNGTFCTLRKKLNLRTIPWIAILESKDTQLLPETLFQSQVYVLLSWSEGHREMFSLGSLTGKQSYKEMKLFVSQFF